MDWNRGLFGRRRQRRRRRGRDTFDCGDALDCGDIGCHCISLIGPGLALTLVGAGSVSADPHTPPPASRPARVASRLVRSYQLNVSARRGPVCNLSPSCSRYGLQVLSRDGLLRGAWLIRARLAECRRAGQRRRALEAGQ